MGLLWNIQDFSLKIFVIFILLTLVEIYKILYRHAPRSIYILPDFRLELHAFTRNVMHDTRKKSALGRMTKNITSNKSWHI